MLHQQATLDQVWITVGQVTLKRVQKQTRILIIATCALTATFASWGVSSPISSDIDVGFHFSSIWCAWGTHAGICETPDAAVTAAFTDPHVLVPAYVQPSDGSRQMQLLNTASRGQKNAYYGIMRLFVTPNVTMSVLVIRLLNSLIAGLFFFFAMYLSRGRSRLAALTAWTFTLLPVLISTIPQINPRSWAYIGVMNAWLFLYVALTTNKDERTRKFGASVMYGISFVLAIFSRWDATLFILYSSAIIVLGIMHQRKLLTKHLITVMATVTVVLLMVSRLVPRLRSFSSFSFPPLYSKQQFVAFQLVHIPENVANALGLGFRQDDLGPGIVGIIGVALFTVCLVQALKSANKLQLFSVFATLLFIMLSMFRVMDFGMQPPPGVYVAALLTVLLGITVLFATQNTTFMSTRNERTAVFVLLGLVHTLSLYAKLENSVRGGEYTGTYERLSLSGGWWWNSPVGPNLILLIGSIALCIWMIFAWSMYSESAAHQ